ncbi:MAG: glycosyltransferase [Burkholderiaceae bacterium]
MAETIAGLERLGLRPRLYALDAATDNAASARDAGRSQPFRQVAMHLQRLATAPLRYLIALTSAALRHRAGLAEFALAVRLTQTLQRDGIVHVHACDLACASLAQSVACLSGMRFSTSLASQTLDAANRRALERSVSAAHFTLLPTDTALRAVKEIAPRAAVHRVYPSVDSRHYSPKLRSRPASVPLLLAVGEARARWDMAPLVEACRRLAQGGTVLRCEVVGAAHDLPSLQAQIDRCGLRDRVRLVGPLSASKLMERYSRAAIFVQVPSVAAHASLAGIPPGLLEAMAMGMPVIAARTPATEECVTHASSGWLVASGDASQLFDAIQRLLVEPRLGESLGKKARETAVERFDCDTNLQTLQQLLEDASRRAALAPAQPTAPATRDPHANLSIGIRRPAVSPQRVPPELHHA